MANPKILDKLLERGERIDRRQLEDYLKETAQENLFLRNAIEIFDSGIVILDNNLRVVEINPSAEFLLGVSARKIKEAKITICPLDKVLLEFLEKVFSSTENFSKQDLFLKFPREQLLRITVSPVMKEQEIEAAGWIISVQDITEFNRANIEKVQTEKLKALVTMAGILAHELGNPLNSLSIHLQLINKAIKTFPEKFKSKTEKLIKITQAEVKRLDDIVTRFLQATRPLKPRFIEGDINRVLDETLEFIGAELKKNKFRVIKKFSKELPKVYIDHLQMRQAFVNIIKNAIEAKSENPRLDVETKLEGDNIKITFADNGLGIPDEELEKIFEPYYSTKSGGSGLGLFVVNKIIRNHGGTVEIKSRPNEGAVLKIYLPAEPAGPKLLTEAKNSYL